MNAVPRLLVHDDGQHGVARYASEIAESVAALTTMRPPVPRDRVGELPAGTPLHLHFTDRLWGDSPDRAAAAVAALAERHPLSVTLHDVPQTSDGPRNLPRRRAAYAAVCASALGVAVNSAHEAALLREHDVTAGAVIAVPLPVDALAPTTPGADEPADGGVGVLGFFYPGKGHDEALAAAAAASAPRLTVLGRASEGHAEDLAAFVRRGEAAGVDVSVTGYLDDAELLRRCRTVSVPVVAHRHVSASGSLGSWMAAGRRPVATANRYIDEMQALRPGAVTVVRPDALADAVRAAAQHPASTWRADGALPHGRRDAAAAYLAWWGSLPW